MAQWVIHECAGSIPGLTQWVKELVWLWHRPVAAAVAPIQLLPWKLPYAAGAAQKKKKKKGWSPHPWGQILSIQPPKAVYLLCGLLESSLSLSFPICKMKINNVLLTDF